jgi:translation initiation factor IF-2
MASAGTTVKELAEKLGIKANLIIKTLVDRGVFATINQTLDMETIQDLSKYFGATATEVSYEEEAMLEVEESQEVADLQPRAPVVTVMGHVDHGKTSLLDAIRKTNVADREAGGITQAIGAYHVDHAGRRIVFIDTPGHEAFTRMRARGAEATDVVILVVAADDGVMPQTLEAIDHAKSANVPILVAINKIDRPDSDPDRVKQQLADRGLLPEDWGGDTVMVPVSALKSQNLDQLLEMVLLVADLKEPKANPSRPAVGSVLEAKLDRGQGPVATVLVQNGTLRTGDYFLVGSVFGKVRAMIDDSGKKIKEAPPSTAVVVLGLEGLPDPGDFFKVATDTEKARKIVEYREDKAREQALAKSSRLSLEQFQEQLRAGDIKELPLVMKSDVQGSLEVLTDALENLSTDKVKVRLIHTGVGAISESDVLLAAAANAIIIGFGVRPERSAAVLAEREALDVRLHTVIYELIDEIRRAMAGLLEPILKETFLGRAEVRETFRVTKVGTIAGCLVEEGRVTSSSEVRLLRDNVVVFTGKLGSLRRFKDDVSEVRSGQECGIGIENFNDIKQGDVIEAFVTEKIAQEVLV